MPRGEDIRLQELYRAKLTHRFDSAAPESKLWKFCNSTFGIFLLSSVFISSFSWTYTQWTTAHKERADRERSFQRLQMEIANRLRYAGAMTQRFPSSKYKMVREAIYGYDPQGNLNPSWIRHYSAVFPEYRERNLASLVWELSALSTPQQREEILQLRSRVDVLEMYFDRLQYSEVRRKGVKGLDEFYELTPQDSEKCRAEALTPLKRLEVLTIE